jgi:hypothetical protein
VVQLLLQAGADVNATTMGDDFTALHIAANTRLAEVVQLLLLQAGAKVEARASSYRYTPLHCAAIAGRVEATKLLLSYGADINAATCGGFTALVHLACALDQQHTAMVQLLLDKGTQCLQTHFSMQWSMLHQRVCCRWWLLWAQQQMLAC